MFMIGLTDLMLRGVSVELSYNRLKGKSLAFRKERKRYWNGIIQSMRKTMAAASRKLKSAKIYRDEMKKDVDKILVNYKKRSHSEFAEAAYNFLMEKYQWRDWLVISYNDISGGSKHWQRVCSGYLKFRVQGRNFAIASVPRYRRPIGHSTMKDAANKIINDLKISKTKKTGLFGWGRATVIKGAEEIFNGAPAEPKTICRPYAAFGVIRSGSGTVYKAPPNRLLRQHKKYKRYRTKYDVYSVNNQWDVSTW